MPLDNTTLHITPTTFLRPIALEDTASLYAAVDANRAHLRQWLPWVDRTACEADQHPFIESVIAQRTAGTGAVWLIINDDSIQGVCGFNLIDDANRKAEMGYWLAESAQHQGLMTRAVFRLLRHGFEDLNLNRIAILAATENHRSRAIPQRLGFTLEGTLHQAEWLYDHFVDHAIYALLHADFHMQE
jgi:ribosomal-protein-serine acetyltransferase